MNINLTIQKYRKQGNANLFIKTNNLVIQLQRRACHHINRSLLCVWQRKAVNYKLFLWLILIINITHKQNFSYIEQSWSRVHLCLSSFTVIVHFVPSEHISLCFSWHYCKYIIQKIKIREKSFFLDSPFFFFHCLGFLPTKRSCWVRSP